MNPLKTILKVRKPLTNGCYLVEGQDFEMEHPTTNETVRYSFDKVYDSQIHQPYFYADAFNHSVDQMVKGKIEMTFGYGTSGVVKVSLNWNFGRSKYA